MPTCLSAANIEVQVVSGHPRIVGAHAQGIEGVSERSLVRLPYSELSLDLDVFEECGKARTARPSHAACRRCRSSTVPGEYRPPCNRRSVSMAPGNGLTASSRDDGVAVGHPDRCRTSSGCRRRCECPEHDVPPGPRQVEAALTRPLRVAPQPVSGAIDGSVQLLRSHAGETAGELLAESEPHRVGVAVRVQDRIVLVEQ